MIYKYNKNITMLVSENQEGLSLGRYIINLIWFNVEDLKSENCRYKSQNEKGYKVEIEEVSEV